MAYTLETEILIDASAERVWAILTDFARYPEWNPFVVRIDGHPELGQRLEIELHPPGGKAMTFKPRVTRVEAAKAFAWLGRLLVPGLFDGAHRFEIAALDAGHVRFTHAERFSGVLVPLLRKSLDTNTRAGFEAMNQALKRRAEATGAHIVT